MQSQSGLPNGLSSMSRGRFFDVQTVLYMLFMQLLCVSGGSDSISLLHLTVAVCQRLQPPLQVEVIHFNHNLRAESSEEVRCGCYAYA